MATLEVGVPLKTREAVVEGPANLPVGRYRVVLMVAGRTAKSEPVELILNVVRSRILRPPIG
jgi:hypothetical protein